MSDAGSVDPLGVYLAAIARIPLLTKDDEQRLGRAIEAGREAARQVTAGTVLRPGPLKELHALMADGERATVELVEANLRLVVSIAKRYRGVGLPLLDLIQEGNLGLLDAIDRFDHTRGFRFSTYSSFLIQHAIAEAVHTGRMIRLPLRAGKAAARVQKAQHLLEAQLTRAPTTAELAAELGMDPPQVARILGYPADPLSLSGPLAGGEDLELSDVIADPRSQLAFEDAMAALLPTALSRLVSLLTPREQDVLRLRFGLGPEGEPRTLQEVGNQLHLSKERIRQIEAAAMKKLRRRIRSLESDKRPNI